MLFVSTASNVQKNMQRRICTIKELSFLGLIIWSSYCGCVKKRHPILEKSDLK